MGNTDGKHAWVSCRSHVGPLRGKTHGYHVKNCCILQCAPLVAAHVWSMRGTHVGHSWDPWNFAIWGLFGVKLLPKQQRSLKFNLSTDICSQEFKYTICKTTTILSKPQCVKYCSLRANFNHVRSIIKRAPSYGVNQITKFSNWHGDYLTLYLSSQFFIWLLRICYL